MNQIANTLLSELQYKIKCQKKITQIQVLHLKNLLSLESVRNLHTRNTLYKLKT